MNIYEFMGDHPILTFFLAVIIGQTLVGLVRGHRPRKVKPILVVSGNDDDAA